MLIAMPVFMLISYPCTCSCPCDICLFQIPNHFFLSFSFVMLWDRFVHIQRRGGGVHIRIWQADLTTWLFLRCCLKPFSFFLFFSLILVLLLFFCVLLLFCTVCACAVSPSTNKCLPHSYDFDGHGTSRNDRISYSYNKGLIEQS